MAEYNLFMGGNRTANPGYYVALPSTDVHPDQNMVPTSHKGTVRYSLTRHLDWKTDDCDHTHIATGSMFLHEFLKHYTPVEGDVLNLVLMSRWTSLTKVWWMIKEPLEGFTFDLQIRGNANSLGGTPDAPAPILLAEDVDGGAVPAEGECPFVSGLVGIAPDAQGDPNCAGIYFDQNDMLQMVIKTLPVGGIDCSKICISPVVDEYCEGAW